MRQLIFFTGNQTKLAHARYVAEGYPISIVGFRQRTYHAGYDEPRLTSRDDLLRASYISAVEQCEKAGISLDGNAFILEDTSVRIEAFSDSETEFPGTEVKFWMAEQNFANLDRRLIELGNNRRVSVRSDVLLHVPRSQRQAWKTNDDYIVFVGTQSGSIVEREHNFETNLVFPWLDNRTFNKWFQPDGFDTPFGSLGIEDADKVDFRRHSFQDLFQFLMEMGYAANTKTQLKLSLDRSPTILLCGYTCCGKTTAAQWLAREFGYLHVEASDFMHLSYLYRHGYKGPIKIGDYAEEALKQKPHIAAEKVVEYILNHSAAPVVISGFRSLAEVQYAERRLAEAGKDLVKCFIEADQDKRFERLRNRMRNDDELDIAKLQMRDDQQGRMGLDRIQMSNGFRHITNNSGIYDYTKKIRRLVNQDTRNAMDIGHNIQTAANIKEIKLEDAIKIALLTAWEDDERRRSFTTTEIARMIRDTFPNVVPKHKDNVSRYFNQDFYPYYEITGDEERRKYRLSNTGYGEAIKALRDVVSNFVAD